VIFDRLKILLAGTLRRQLVVGMVIVVATLMSLFVWDLTRRQQTAILEQQSVQAVALARSVATSSAVWVASRDFSGLQEILNGLARYPDLQHAIVLDTKGQVLAHTDVSRRGLYLTDLPARPVQKFLGQDAAMVDVASPITLAGKHIGWVRIGMGQQSMAVKLADIARSGMAYTLLAVILAAILATVAAYRLTRRLYAIQSVADAVQAGRSELRVGITGVDEAARLARQFNGMLDTLAKREAEIVASHDALAQSESRLNQVMAVTGEGIWDWNLETNRVRHNPGWCAMLGLDDSHLEHPLDVFTALLHEGDREAVATRIQDCLAGKGAYRSEHRMRHADGRVIWVQDRGDVAERDSAGRPSRMLGSMTDISERKRVEKALVKLNQELEQRVEQRTADMKAAKDEAERASAAKSDFLSSMSHELRTPMNAILGFSQLMEYDDTLSDEHRDNVQEILKAGHHLLDLINEVLDLARVESGRIDLSLEPVDVSPIVEECLKLVGTLADKRDIRISHGDLEGVVVRADRTRLRQALLNLLSNAIKYNDEGGSVSIEARPEGTARLRIRVTDSGPGIPAARLAELFKPFNRLGAEATEIEGTGIGLTITRRLIEVMGGSVDVESEVGTGSTFWIELPLEFTPDNDHGRDHETAADGATPAQDTGATHHTVLYIEDNPANLKLVAQIIGRRHHIHLLTAHTPELGIELAQMRHPDLILLDINMPGMDGYQVLEALRADAALKHITVIAVTANAMPRDIERGMAAGFSDYLTKPINVAKFLDILDRSLPGHVKGDK
jgi:PAS domain S-box-containing protein